MDAAVKKSSAKKIRKGDIDLEQAADQEIEEMRNRMIAAAEADGELSILDPQTSLLEAVRFFLEPLSDGSLQAYNIQRELFAALAKLPMNKETLISSGVDKVMLFYRKSKRADPAIKRQATKLMEQWLRLVLQRTDDYTKKTWARATSDPTKRRDDLGQPAIVPKATAKVAPGQKQKQWGETATGCHELYHCARGVDNRETLKRNLKLYHGAADKRVTGNLRSLYDGTSIFGALRSCFFLWRGGGDILTKVTTINFFFAPISQESFNITAWL
ncbi:Transcription factor iws1 [Exophiala xenobiotica]|nr:Transcription factor iws1 [Exophiala xenobiotica]KAK5458906.1 Transcription factor iws1 [Exophiala xenobiotica]